MSNKKLAILIGNIAVIVVSIGIYMYTNNREPISPIFPPSVQFWNDTIVDASYEFGVDKNMIAAVMTVESCGHPTIAHPDDGIGLMQILRWWFTTSKLSHVADDPYNTRDNVRMGAAILRYNIDVLDDERLAMAAFADNTSVRVGNMSYSAARHYDFGWAMVNEDTPEAVEAWRSELGRYCKEAEVLLGI